MNPVDWQKGALRLLPELAEPIAESVSCISHVKAHAATLTDIISYLKLNYKSLAWASHTYANRFYAILPFLVSNLVYKVWLWCVPESHLDRKQTASEPHHKSQSCLGSDARSLNICA